MMTTELPEAAAKQLGDIRAKLLECLVAGVQDQTEARSEFKRYGVSEGGVVLHVQPAIQHPDFVIDRMYSSMFDQAKQEGVELRDIATSFRRTPGGAWRFETRWVTVDEYSAFTESVRPIVEEIRIALRDVGSALGADWYMVSFNVRRIVVLSQDRARTSLEPSGELQKFVARIEAKAQRQGLEFTGAEWTVTSNMDDAEGEIESSIGVI